MNFNIHSHTSHFLYDVESEIVKARNTPSPINLVPWQRRIDKIVGKTADNKSRLRVMWLQSPQAFYDTSLGRRAKKPFYRYEEGGEMHDIGLPRFAIEELHTNAELNKNDDWERHRYSWMDGEKVDLLGDIPADGFYSLLFIIAYHDELCCNGRGIIKQEECPGAYRPPCDADLQRIRRAHYMRENAANDEIAPSAERIMQREENALEARDARWQSEIHETVRNFTDVHGHRFGTHSDKHLRWGKYLFTGGHSKSGLTQEQIAAARTSIRPNKETTNADSSSNSAT